MEKWLKKNLRWVTLVVFVLFVFKTIQSCNRGMSIRIQEKNMIEDCDSLLNEKDRVITGLEDENDSLRREVTTRDFIIKDQANDLEIAGVKVNEAERRADAVQRTAEAIRANTTIEIKGAEKDSTKNK